MRRNKQRDYAGKQLMTFENVRLARVDFTVLNTMIEEAWCSNLSLVSS